MISDAATIAIALSGNFAASLVLRSAYSIAVMPGVTERNVSFGSAWQLGRHGSYVLRPLVSEDAFHGVAAQRTVPTHARMHSSAGFGDAAARASKEYENHESLDI